MKRNIEDWMHGRSRVMVISTGHKGVLAGMKTEKCQATEFTVCLDGRKTSSAFDPEDIERLDTGEYLISHDNAGKRQRFVAGDWYFIGLKSDYQYRFVAKSDDKSSDYPGHIEKRKYTYGLSEESSFFIAIVTSCGSKRIFIAGDLAGAHVSTDIWFIAMSFSHDEWLERMRAAGHYKRPKNTEKEAGQ